MQVKKTGTPEGAHDCPQGPVESSPKLPSIPRVSADGMGAAPTGNMLMQAHPQESPRPQELQSLTSI